MIIAEQIINAKNNKSIVEIEMFAINSQKSTGESYTGEIKEILGTEIIFIDDISGQIKIIIKDIKCINELTNDILRQVKIKIRTRELLKIHLKDGSSFVGKIMSVSYNYNSITIREAKKLSFTYIRFNKVNNIDLYSEWNNKVVDLI